MAAEMETHSSRRSEGSASSPSRHATHVVVTMYKDRVLCLMLLGCISIYHHALPAHAFQAPINPSPPSSLVRGQRQSISFTALFGTGEPVPIDVEYDDWDDDDHHHDDDEEEEDYMTPEPTLRALSTQISQTQKQLQVQQQQIQQMLQVLLPSSSAPYPTSPSETSTVTDKNGDNNAPINGRVLSTESFSVTTASSSSSSSSSVTPLRVMVFIDGTWAYYSLFERGSKCPVARQYGRHWYKSYRFDWEALPRIICQALRDTSWQITNTDNHQEPSRPLEIMRMSVFTSFKADTPEDSLRFQLFQDMRSAGYDVHQMETVGKSEKCVDIQIAVEILHFATVPNSYDIAVILSGDKDFMPALIRVRQKGRQVAIVSMKSGCNRALYETDGLKDYEMIWLEDHLDELIVLKDPLHVNGDGGEGATTINPLVIGQVIWDFIKQSGYSVVSSRDVGRYLKSVTVAGHSLLEEIKENHRGLKYFLTYEDHFEMNPGPGNSYMIGLKEERAVLEQLHENEANLSEEDTKLLNRVRTTIPTDKVTAFYFTSQTINGLETSGGTEKYFVPEVQVVELPDDLRADYASFTVAKLKERCKERGLSTSGLKADLLERVETDVKEQVAELQKAPSNVHDVRAQPQVGDYILELIKEYLHARGGKASSRDVGRYLAANKRQREGSHEIISANQELKAYFGGLKFFVEAHADVLDAEHNYVDGNDAFGKYAFMVSLKHGVPA